MMQNALKPSQHMSYSYQSKALFEHIKFENSENSPLSSNSFSVKCSSNKDAKLTCDMSSLIFTLIKNINRILKIFVTC